MRPDGADVATADTGTADAPSWHSLPFWLLWPAAYGRKGLLCVPTRGTQPIMAGKLRQLATWLPQAGSRGMSVDAQLTPPFLFNPGPN